MMIKHTNDCYLKTPIDHKEGIPIFSKIDFYVENYDRISRDHLEHFKKTGKNPFMQEDHWQEIESSTQTLIAKYASAKDSKILDVGVGMGRLLERFPQYQRFGMDISIGYLKHAKSKGIEVCMSRIEDMPYRKHFFDICVTTDVLEHVLDLNLVVTQILSVLKEGGILVVRVPFREDLSGYLQAGYPYDLVHLRNFDENSLRMLFEKIFKLKVLEWNLTGYSHGQLKIGANVRYYTGIVKRFLRLIGNLNVKIHKILCKSLLQPIEINMVIKNSKTIHLEAEDNWAS